MTKIAEIDRETLVDALRALASLARVEFPRGSLAEHAYTLSRASEYEIDALRMVETRLLCDIQ